MTAKKMIIAECENSKKYWYWYCQYFSKAVSVLVLAVLFAKVLLLVLSVVFRSIVNIPGIYCMFNASFGTDWCAVSVWVYHTCSNCCESSTPGLFFSSALMECFTCILRNVFWVLWLCVWLFKLDKYSPLHCSMSSVFGLGLNFLSQDI